MSKKLTPKPSVAEEIDALDLTIKRDIPLNSIYPVAKSGISARPIKKDNEDEEVEIDIVIELPVKKLQEIFKYLIVLYTFAIATYLAAAKGATFFPDFTDFFTYAKLLAASATTALLFALTFQLIKRNFDTQSDHTGAPILIRIIAAFLACLAILTLAQDIIYLMPDSLLADIIAAFPTSIVLSFFIIIPIIALAELTKPASRHIVWSAIAISSVIELFATYVFSYIVLYRQGLLHDMPLHDAIGLGFFDINTISTFLYSLLAVVPPIVVGIYLAKSDRANQYIGKVSKISIIMLAVSAATYLAIIFHMAS